MKFVNKQQFVNKQLTIFADDTKLFRVIKSNSDIAILQDDLNTMIDWSDKWLLRFNKEKCKLLSINGQTLRIIIISTVKNTK